MQVQRNLCGVLTLACLLPASAAAANSGTLGQAWVGAANGSPAYSSIAHPVFAGDSIASANDHGALAAATCVASLASATLYSSAGATADPASSYFNSAAAEVTSVSFFDRLTFLIPEGVYSAPVFVRLYGFSLGSLYSQGCTSPAGDTCSNGYNMLNLRGGSSCGEADFTWRREVNAGTNAAAGFDALFTLDVPILRATTLVAPLNSVVSVSGYAITKGTAPGTHGYPLGADYTMFAGDVFAGFSAMDVPAGITWTSDSGVFLSQPVPEAPPAVLLLAGLATLGWLLRRRRA